MYYTLFMYVCVYLSIYLFVKAHAYFQKTIVVERSVLTYKEHGVWKGLPLRSKKEPQTQGNFTHHPWVFYNRAEVYLPSGQAWEKIEEEGAVVIIPLPVNGGSLPLPSL